MQDHASPSPAIPLTFRWDVASPHDDNILGVSAEHIANGYIVTTMTRDGKSSKVHFPTWQEASDTMHRTINPVGAMLVAVEKQRQSEERVQVTLDHSLRHSAEGPVRSGTVTSAASKLSAKAAPKAALKKK